MVQERQPLLKAFKYEIFLRNAKKIRSSVTVVCLSLLESGSKSFLNLYDLKIFYFLSNIYVKLTIHFSLEVLGLLKRYVPVEVSS
jgi:hypothetical protein